MKKPKKWVSREPVLRDEPLPVKITRKLVINPDIRFIVAQTPRTFWQRVADFFRGKP